MRFWAKNGNVRSVWPNDLGRTDNTKPSISAGQHGRIHHQIQLGNNTYATMVADNIMATNVMYTEVGTPPEVVL